MFSLNITGIHFSKIAKKEEYVENSEKTHYYQFQFQILDDVIAYPELLKESEIFSQFRPLRDYSIVLHAIRSEILQEDVKVLFGLISDANKSEYCIAWEISLASLLFGPSELSIPHTNAKLDNIQYNIIFHNKSSRVNDYSVIVRSLHVSNLPPSTYSYLYYLKYAGKSFENPIESISVKPIELSDGSPLTIHGSSKVHLSAVENTSLELHIFDSTKRKTAFSFSLTHLLSYPLFSLCTFPMECGGDGPEADVVLEILPMDLISSCIESKQLQDNHTIKNIFSRQTPTSIPIEIVDASFILPHAALSLGITSDGYSFQRESVELLTIPFATIENSSLSDKQSLGKGLCLGTVNLFFNRAGKSFSDWICMRVVFDENHPVWELFALSPQLTQHKNYHFEKKLQHTWVELKDKHDHSVYQNTATGRITSAIPTQRSIVLPFTSMEELRPVDLVTVQWNQDRSILVKNVTEDCLRRKIAAGYFIVSILFNMEKEWVHVDKTMIEVVCEKLLQAQSYPLQICFANPYC